MFPSQSQRPSGELLSTQHDPGHCYPWQSDICRGASAGGKPQQLQEAMTTFNQSQLLAPATATSTSTSTRQTDNSLPRNGLRQNAAATSALKPVVPSGSDAPTGSLNAAPPSSFEPAAAVESARKAAEALSPISDLNQGLSAEVAVQPSQGAEAEQPTSRLSSTQR